MASHWAPVSGFSALMRIPSRPSRTARTTPCPSPWPRREALTSARTGGNSGTAAAALPPRAVAGANAKVAGATITQVNAAAKDASTVEQRMVKAPFRRVVGWARLA